MKLDLSEIVANLGKRIRYEIDEPPIEDLDGVRCVTPIKGEATFTNTSKHVVVRGHFSTTVELDCARCAGPYRMDLTLPIEEELRISGHVPDVPVEEDEEEELPEDAKKTIFALMHNQTPVTQVHPIFQDGETIPFMWKTLLQKNGLTDVSFAKIPTQKYNEMILEIAKGAVVAMNVFDMLQNDPESRYSYAVAKNKLGYKGVKLTQLPTDALELIQGAMVNRIYMPTEHKATAHKQYNKHVVSGLRKRPATSYPTKTFSGFTPYDTHKGVYPNYNSTFQQFKDSGIYEDMYTKFGTSRMSLMMRDLSPKRMQYRVHYMANLMKY
jgi:hypothetical protein